jgi:hydrogenase/urease accessory protein HupE
MTAHTYRADVRIPPSIEADNQPEVSWPASCTPASQNVRAGSESIVETILVRCNSGLEGQRIGIHYPIYNPAISTLFRFNPSSQEIRTAVLPPDVHEWLAPASMNWRTVARDYLVLGIKHIWEGIDHLLFVLGLLMLARTPRRIAVAVTGFTLAHSLTLSLSALGLVRLPVPPIEAGIALSILFLAREIAKPDPQSLARRFPLAISSSFGLLHGFGFAAALSEAGLPRNEIAPALLFFNAGVEVGQLLFIALVLGIIAAVVWASSHLAQRIRLQPVFQRAEFVGAYALGLASSFWLLERIQVFWAR